MILNEKVEIEYEGKRFDGRITKVIDKFCCVVSWQYKDRYGFHQHNKLFERNEVREVRGSRIWQKY